MDAAPVNVVVTLARSKIKTAELLDLAVGDLITTEKEISEPLELSIQDVPKYFARAGAFKGKKAVQVEALIEKPQRDERG
jgi:flagellar motor switch protein FliM